MSMAGSTIVSLRDVSKSYENGTLALSGFNFDVREGEFVSLLGPSGCGKSTALRILAGLADPNQGAVDWTGNARQIGFVFQDSSLFNLTLRENIAFNSDVDEARLNKAIETAELHQFIAGLPLGLETIVSERGLSLSGGQKQRIMLARALALDPKILFLDDFTARVDLATEAKILGNVRRNYPDLTLISITQKIAPVEDYDQIILLMEGEVLAAGTHETLVRTSPEYGQILRSQQSTDAYEAA